MFIRILRAFICIFHSINLVLQRKFRIYFPHIQSFSSFGLCLILVCGLGCGSQAPIKTPPPPKWVSATVNHWDARRPQTLFARGQVAKLSSISQRRALAEAAAIENARKYIVKTVPTEKEILSKLPWAELSQVDKRFFDAPNNTQYTLVRITFTQCQRWVKKYSGYSAQKQQKVQNALNRLFAASSSTVSP